jgi:hypothetical protein
MARRWFRSSLAARLWCFDRPSRTTLTPECAAISGFRRQPYGSDAANVCVKSHYGAAVPLHPGYSVPNNLIVFVPAMTAHSPSLAMEEVRGSIPLRSTKRD